MRPPKFSGLREEKERPLSVSLWNQTAKKLPVSLIRKADCHSSIRTNILSRIDYYYVHTYSVDTMAQWQMNRMYNT